MDEFWKTQEFMKEAEELAKKNRCMYLLWEYALEQMIFNKNGCWNKDKYDEKHY